MKVEVKSHRGSKASRLLFSAALIALSGLLSFSCADKKKEEAAKQEALRIEQARQDSIKQIATARADSIAAAQAAIPDEPEPPPRPALQIEWGTYTVQIASYDSREAAMPFFKTLEAEGREPYILEEAVTDNGGEHTIYRLRFGKFSSKDEAHNKGSEVALVHELDYWVDNYKR